MTNYTEIINAYMNFFACCLFECVDDSRIKLYFEDVYSQKKQFDKNIEKCIYELYMPDIYSTEGKDIIVFFDAVISCMRSKIRNQLAKIEDKEKKTIFYTLAAFQAAFHGRANVIIGGKNIDLTNAHPMERCVLGLAKEKKYTSEIKSIYVRDKYVLQMIFQECIMAQHIQDNLTKTIMNVETFVNIYGMALTVMQLISWRWMLALGIINKPELRICVGKVEFKDNCTYNVEGYKEKFEADMIQYSSTYPENVRGLLDKNFQKMYGFRVDTVRKIVSSMPVIFVNNDLVTESNYETIIKELILTSNCTKKEAEKIFDYLILDETKTIEKLSESPEKDNNRIFEKCILKIGEDRYLYSSVLMFYAYVILLRKLEFNLLKRCEKLNAEIIEKKIKKNFEEKVKKYIEQYCPKVLLNVHKLDNGAILSNEVDVMFVIEGKLYIVECKDVIFRYTPNGFMADINKERSFIKKMISKKESVINNITYFEEKFEQRIDEVKGVLVYRTTNFVTETIKLDKDIMIMSFEEFKDALPEMGKSKA